MANRMSWETPKSAEHIAWHQSDRGQLNLLENTPIMPRKANFGGNVMISDTPKSSPTSLVSKAPPPPPAPRTLAVLKPAPRTLAVLKPAPRTLAVLKPAPPPQAPPTPANPIQPPDASRKPLAPLPHVNNAQSTPSSSSLGKSQLKDGTLGGGQRSQVSELPVWTVME
jgi:hypothetical protein